MDDEQHSQAPETDAEAQRRQAVQQALERAQQRRSENEGTRHLPLEPAAPKSLDAARILQVEDPAPPEVRKPALLFALLAGAAWGSSMLLLGANTIDPQSGAVQRLLFSIVVITACLSTFGPLQWSLRLPALTWRGTVGWWLIFYSLAFIPAPRGTTLSLPELPVYGLILFAIFLAANATALPLIYALGLRLFRQRAVRFDLRRTGRQAFEIGCLAVIISLLGIIGELHIISGVLAIASITFIEIFLLSRQGAGA